MRKKRGSEDRIITSSRTFSPSDLRIQIEQQRQAEICWNEWKRVRRVQCRRRVRIGKIWVRNALQPCLDIRVQRLGVDHLDPALASPRNSCQTSCCSRISWSASTAIAASCCAGVEPSAERRSTLSSCCPSGRHADHEELVEVVAADRGAAAPAADGRDCSPSSSTRRLNASQLSSRLK